MNVDELLQELKPWFATVARGYRVEQQELIQEAMIAAWEAYGKSDGRNVKSFMKKAGLWRMDSIAGNRSAFGNKAPWGGAIRYEPRSTESPVWDSLPPAFQRALDLSYHMEEILVAIRELPEAQKEYVYLRFWLGYNTPELNKHFGYACSPLWTRAKLKLRESLAHLEGLT